MRTTVVALLGIRGRVIGAALGIFAVSSSPAIAECDLREFVGYTIAAVKTVTGFIENGAETDGFEGCNFGRTLVFSDRTGLNCAGYGYQYAYRPEAILLVSGSSIKACIGSEVYDLTRMP